ncbi:hypothetical protein J3A83DRAFT_4402171 [Scleroderma citrinum]
MYCQDAMVEIHSVEGALTANLLPGTPLGVPKHQQSPGINIGLANQSAWRQGNQKKCQELASIVEIAISMKVMVTTNVETDLDVVNGMQGTIVVIFLHLEESYNETEGEVILTFLPLFILVKLNCMMTNLDEMTKHWWKKMGWSYSFVSEPYLFLAKMHSFYELTVLVVDITALQCLCGCAAVTGGAMSSGSMLLGWQMKTRPTMKSWKANMSTGLCSTEAWQKSILQAG